MAGPAVHERHSQNRICDAFRRCAAGFCTWLAPQFTRAIRKTASAMLSAAAQLIFAHEKALSSDVHVSRFSCKHEICPQEHPSELRESTY
ncbi:hypothetical protein RJD28_12285 [Oscillospiraceae bacterium NTUH-002-81]|nr:hypothetical protein RJD28_12285 [Oscillospiraceae bacterium NTUH-002-81]